MWNMLLPEHRGRHGEGRCLIYASREVCLRWGEYNNTRRGARILRAFARTWLLRWNMESKEYRRKLVREREKNNGML